jgi:DNA-directed RNA polymerase
MLSPQEQYQYEVESDTAAAAAKLEQLRKDALEGDITLPRAQRFMASAYSEVSLSLAAVQESKARGVGGRVRSWIKAIPLEVVTALSIRVCVRALSMRYANKPVTLQSLAGQLGRAIELEVRIREAEKVNPMYMQRIHEQIKDRKTTDMDHLRGVYMNAYKQVMKEGVESRLSESEIMQVGKFGIDACIQAGMVKQTRTWGSKGRLLIYELVDEVWEFLSGYGLNDVRHFVDPGTRGMQCPPEPWTNLNDGGYYSPRRKFNMPLMSLRRIRKAERERLRSAFTAENMPHVFGCANFLQSIAHTVHQPTFDAIRKVWMAGGGVLGVPNKNPPAIPVFPLGEEFKVSEATPEQQELLTVWKRKAAEAYDDIREWRSRTQEISGFVRHSAVCAPGEPTWFPVFMDTRNRYYYRGSPNPQGTDLAKAVLHMHTKKPLGQRGLFWLKVAVASNFGYDKARFADRAAWTEAQWPRIESALDAPEDHPDVFGDDSPWCMFTAAWELREALRSPNPWEYETGVPVHMDATCSGIQHFSAMLRDPVGGKFVNLYDDSFVGPKNDIYGEVGNNALKAIRCDLKSTDLEVQLMATFWLEYGVSRNMAKKPVMTYVYGATLRGTAQFVLKTVEDDGGTFPVGVTAFTCCIYLARKLFQGIGSTVPAAEYGMHWLRNVAKRVPKGRRMEWKTPTGFLVQHDYQAFDEVRVELRSCGVRTMLVHEPTDGIRPLQMQNAIAPNFVHSLDAAHLTFTALDMESKGLSMVGIHDSFGTHPCDVDELHKSLREKFIALYSDRHIMSSFLFDVGVPGEAPIMGSLDLSGVRTSEFFFC